MNTLLTYVKWVMIAMNTGKRPALRYDGNPIPHNHVMTRLLAQKGTELGFRGLVCWLKGDLADINHTHGLPSVNSTNSPCMYCTCIKQTMHAFYREMNLIDGMIHELVASGAYEAYCRTLAKKASKPNHPHAPAIPIPQSG